MFSTIRGVHHVQGSRRSPSWSFKVNQSSVRGESKLVELGDDSAWPGTPISFVYGSTMTITIAECNSLPLQEGIRIRQISEDQPTLLLECEDESILDVTIVDPGNSVIVRDKNGQVEYLLSPFPG
jgi:hypothetical protein